MTVTQSASCEVGSEFSDVIRLFLAFNLLIRQNNVIIMLVFFRIAIIGFDHVNKNRAEMP